MMTVYKSKAGLLIKILFAIALAFLLFFALFEKNWAYFSVLAVITAVVFYIFITTHYTIYENSLTIKSGFLFQERIAIDTIKKIEQAKKNLLTGPGFSPDRLVIIYNQRDCIIISPSQKERFLQHLKRINPDIIIE